MIPPELPGLFGVTVMLLTIGVSAVFVLVTFILAMYKSVYGATIKSRNISLQFFFVSLAVLIFDVLFVYLYVSDNGGKSHLSGGGLDSFSIHIWLPVHIFGGLLITLLIWYFNRSEKIN